MLRRLRLLAIALVLHLPAAGFAFAEDLESTARSIITQQIQAFLDDDAEKAYSFASPAIQTKFQNKDIFFSMVKKSYGPVYRPGNYAFGRSKAAGDYFYQEVIISGVDGKDRTAVYGLQKQPDGSYRINGVQIMESADSKGI
jgi:hypothetical protein